MRLLRSACYVVLLTLLAISVTENVRAQSASTSISNLNAPSRALLGREIPVTLTVTYSEGSNRYFFDIAIIDRETNDYAQGTAHASPTDCVSTAGVDLSSFNPALCPFPSSFQASGSVDVTFNLKFQTVKTYHLAATAAYFDSSGKLVQSSRTYQLFSIDVTDKVNLQVLVPNAVSIMVNGVPQGLGPVSIDVDPGTYTIVTPQTVDVKTGERLRFEHWSDGSTSTSKIVNLQDDTSYSVAYVTQYKLTLLSSQGNSTGRLV